MSVPFVKAVRSFARNKMFRCDDRHNALSVNKQIAVKLKSVKQKCITWRYSEKHRSQHRFPERQGRFRGECHISGV